jgi:hypothetical protein
MADKSWQKVLLLIYYKRKILLNSWLIWLIISSSEQASGTVSESVLDGHQRHAGKWRTTVGVGQQAIQHIAAHANI